MNYIVGKIVYKNKYYILLENNFIGYKIYFPNSQKIEIGKILKIYLYQKLVLNINHIIMELYGFSSLKEKQLFKELNKINGIGPKIAMNILEFGYFFIINCISHQEIDALLKIKGVNRRIAHEIIHDIKFEQKDSQKTIIINEVIESLKSLGYNNQEINLCLSNIDDANFFVTNNDISSLISLAIKKINETKIL